MSSSEKNDPSKSPKVLRLSKESVKVLNVRSGVRTGIPTSHPCPTTISGCSATHYCPATALG